MWRLMRISTPVVLGVIVVPCLVSDSRADEAFLCDGGRIEYVNAGNLEAKKHYDPCIAGYFGLTVPGPEEKANLPATTPLQQANGNAAPDKVEKTSVAATGAASGANRIEHIVLKGFEASGMPVRRHHNGATRLATEPPVAAPDTDYRNVKIINAAANSGQWFRHAR
jgi:hypothetical protein